MIGGSKLRPEHRCTPPALLLPFLFENNVLFIYFRERGREGEREREKHQHEREISIRERLISYLSSAPTGNQPKTQACALTGNPTGHLFLCGPTPNQLSHTVQAFAALSAPHLLLPSLGPTAGNRAEASTGRGLLLAPSFSEGDSVTALAWAAACVRVCTALARAAACVRVCSIG